MDDLLTTDEAAERLGVSAGHIRRLVAAGKLHPQRWGKRALIFDAADVDAYTPERAGWPRGKTRGAGASGDAADA